MEVSSRELAARGRRGVLRRGEPGRSVCRWNALLQPARRPHRRRRRQDWTRAVADTDGRAVAWRDDDHGAAGGPRESDRRFEWWGDGGARLDRWTRRAHRARAVEGI